jgi:hypothetical protein
VNFSEHVSVARAGGGTAFRPGHRGGDDMGHTGAVARRLQRRAIEWLERVFFGGAELSVLSSPAFVVVLVLQGDYPDAIPIAGLFALATGSLAIATFRSRVVDVGAWPRRGELASLPLRVGDFSALFFAAAAGVGAAAVAAGTLWVAVLGGVVQPLGLAAFPRVYRAVHGEPLQRAAAGL